MKFIHILFLREFRLRIMPEIASFPESAIAISVEVSTFFSFECGLMQE